MNTFNDKENQSFQFDKDKTFFGLKVYRHGIKKKDIGKLPFYDFW